MSSWLSRLIGTKEAPSERRPAPAAAAKMPPARTAERPPQAEPAGLPLTPAQVDFLTGLVDPPLARDLDDLPPDDRAFMVALQTRLERRELELPVLPEVATRLARMLHEGVLVSEYVALLEEDPVLSVEVLRTANSAFYASSVQMTSLHDAVIRIGLVRLQSILVLTQLRTRVAKGAFEEEAALLLKMALPMAFLASKVTHQHSTRPDLCFMRGLLVKVEYLAIIAVVAQASRDLGRKLSPSVRALHEAFVRFGPQARLAVATEWNMTDLLIGGDDEVSLAAEFDLLQQVFIAWWLRRPLPSGAAAFDRLDTALADPQLMGSLEPAESRAHVRPRSAALTLGS